MTDAPAATIERAATSEAPAAGNWLLAACVAVLCVWVLLPIYLLLVNALLARAGHRLPRSRCPSFDFGSLSFFLNFAGVARALWNSVLVASLTMILSIGIGAPAGYALALRLPGKESFRFLVLMTRAFPLPLWRCRSRSCSSAPGSDDTALGLALVHTTLALPFAVLITFSLFSGIPVELEEAAWTLAAPASRRSAR